MKKQCAILAIGAILCMGMSISCLASQPFANNQPSEKFSNYYQKPMRNLDIELMDEVLEYAASDVKAVIEAINDPDKRESTRLLLVGGPGVGKTTLAQAIAMQTNRPCFIIRAPSLANQYQFSGEQNLIAAISPLFEINEPCIVIIDEIDALKQYKGDKTNQDASPANTLCNLLDDAEDYPNIVFIATTNKLKQLPEDLKSRFGSIITLPLPDECARERIIRYHLEQLGKKGINVEIDDKTIKSLAAKTKGFSARDLKAMITKGKISARNIRSNSLEKAADTIISRDVWQAYKEQKPLIAAGWHVKERIKELFDNHGVALTTFAVSTALTVLGIIISERRSAQSMDQSKKQFNEQIERQKEEKRKAKRDKLIKEYIAQEKLLEDPRLPVPTEQWLKNPKMLDDYYDYLHIAFTLSILKEKLAKNIAEPESNDRKFFKLRAHFFTQDLELFKKKWKHGFYMDKYIKPKL